MRSSFYHIVNVVSFAFGVMGWCLPTNALTVAAATSLTGAAKEIGTTYQNMPYGTKIDLTFGASNTLAKQLEQGAPIDVLITADLESMQQAISKKIIDKKNMTIIASNRLALIVPLKAACPASVKQLRDVIYQKIAVGQPELVPAGRYAQESLNLVGVLPFVKNKLVYGMNVRQVLDYVRRGEVDAGIVYQSDTFVPTTEQKGAQQMVRLCQLLPTKTTIQYFAGPVKSSLQYIKAQLFVQYLKTTTSQKILSQYGFLSP